MHPIDTFGRPLKSLRVSVTDRCNLRCEYCMPIRSGASRTELGRLVSRVWNGRADRGAEARIREHDRAPFVAPAELRRDPHLEMHTRGG